MMKKIFDSEYLNIGSGIQPFNAWLLIRGLRTLPARLDRITRTTAKMVEFLKQHPQVDEVIFPFDPQFPQYELARRQMRAPNGVPAYGGMISFIAHGGKAAAERIACATELFYLAESLGGVESLIEVPAGMTHMSVANSPLEIDPGLVRLSVGIEHADDLMHDLECALDKV